MKSKSLCVKQLENSAWIKSTLNNESSSAASAANSKVAPLASHFLLFFSLSLRVLYAYQRKCVRAGLMRSYNCIFFLSYTKGGKTCKILRANNKFSSCLARKQTPFAAVRVDWHFSLFAHRTEWQKRKKFINCFFFYPKFLKANICGVYATFCITLYSVIFCAQAHLQNCKIPVRCAYIPAAELWCTNITTFFHRRVLRTHTMRNHKRDLYLSRLGLSQVCCIHARI